MSKNSVKNTALTADFNPFYKLLGLVMLVLTFTGCQSLKVEPLPEYLSVDLTLPYSQNEQRVQPLNEVPYPIPEIYKTDKLLLKHVPAQGDQSGFYMTVFEVTQCQENLLLGRPKQNFRYTSYAFAWAPSFLAGSTLQQITSPALISKLGIFTATSSLPFKLPNQRQWLRAFDYESENLDSNNRYINSEVGLSKPNKLGFYDMNNSGSELVIPENIYLGCRYNCHYKRERSLGWEEKYKESWNDAEALPVHKQLIAPGVHEHDRLALPLNAYRLVLPEHPKPNGLLHLSSKQRSYMAGKAVPIKAQIVRLKSKLRLPKPVEYFDNDEKLPFEASDYEDVTHNVTWTLSDGTILDYDEGMLKLPRRIGTIEIIGHYKEMKAALSLHISPIIPTK